LHRSGAGHISQCPLEKASFFHISRFGKMNRRTWLEACTL
jgi:hypothetical protein